MEIKKIAPVGLAAAAVAALSVVALQPTTAVAEANNHQVTAAADHTAKAAHSPFFVLPGEPYYI